MFCILILVILITCFSFPYSNQRKEIAQEDVVKSGLYQQPKNFNSNHSENGRDYFLRVKPLGRDQLALWLYTLY